MEKILFIVNGVAKNGEKIGVSGSEIRLFEISKYLNGYEINYLCSKTGEILIKNFKVKYKDKHVINYSVGEGVLPNLIISLKSFFQLPNSLSGYKGLVYSSSEHLYDVLPALRLKIFNGCKWYAVYHWVEDYPWIDKRGNTPTIKRYLYWLNRVFSGLLIKYFSDNILAVSEQTKEKLIKIKKIHPNKIKAVYCGVEVDRIVKLTKKHSLAKEKLFDAIYIKRLNYGKGVVDLLKIWQEVCRHKSNARLAIVGDGPKYVVDEIKNFIIKNNLGRNILLLGVIYDFEKKVKLLNSSKLFILPSNEENWAIVIGEAMACKVPVIAYSLKEIRPIWKDNLEWIKVGQINNFSNKILFLLENKNIRNFYAEKGLKFIRQYDWKDIAETELQD